MSKKKKRPTSAPASTPQPPQSPKPSALHIEVDGLALTIDGTALDDVELFDMLDGWDGSNPAAGLRMIPKIIRGLFGDDQFDQVMDHLRDPDTRRVSFEKAALFVGGAIGALDPNS